MKSTLVILFALLGLIQAIPLNSRIVNGKDAELGEIPFQISMQLHGGHYCGGSILNEYYVLTAAHCLVGWSASSVQVAVGFVSLEKAKQKHQAVELIVHENYYSSLMKNDIGLIKVETPFQFSELVQPASLPEFHSKVKTNATATVSGWGNLHYMGESPDHLQKADIFIADPAYCRKALSEGGYTIYDSNVCANDPTERRGQCNGDSGGPLTVDGKLTGIVSYSIKDPDCASTKYPGVYTRVSEFIDWINEHAV